MMKHTRDDEHPSKPCPHMKTLLSTTADGNLRGLLLRFTRVHVAGCAPCRGALDGLLILRTRMQTLYHSETQTETLVLTTERRARLEEAWLRVDLNFDRS